jgi:hypothetical protein
MPLPYDGWSLVALGGAAALLLLAAWARVDARTRVLAICAAALLIRLDPSWQASLHEWDESVHAVVARHVSESPLRPSLYPEPLMPLPEYDWTETDVWLHKPPLAFWLMGASLTSFGIGALVLRLPSVVLSTLCVFLTYATGRRLAGPRVALLAAAFQAVNGLLVSLASGRRVADHVDTALITCVQTGMLALISGAQNGRLRRSAWLAGAAMGAGLLAKSAPALVIGVVACALWAKTPGWRQAGPLVARLLGGAALVAGPWTLYTWVIYPAEAARAQAYLLQHIFRVVEGHSGGVWSYLLAMPRLYGELVFLSLVWLAIVAWRTTPSWRLVGWWLAVPYVVFSLMATKLTAFVAIAAPAVFLVEAGAWMWLRDRVPSIRAKSARSAAVVLLALGAALPARYLLEPAGPFERRDRFPASTRQLQELDAIIAGPRAVIFNAPKPFELMFYSRHVAYARLPGDDDVRRLRESGIRVFIFRRPGESLAVPDEWGATVLDGR